jgi:Bacterial HORMA domain 2
MTTVAVNTYAHSVTYVAENILRSLQDIIRESGLSPSKIADDWIVLERGLRTWLTTRHLERVVLEVYEPGTDELVNRWDIEIFYSSFDGDGDFWIDTDQIKFYIRKAGLWPSECEYRIVATNKTGRPDVLGWSSITLRSTDGLIRQSIGTTIGTSGISAGASYYRRANP